MVLHQGLLQPLLLPPGAPFLAPRALEGGRTVPGAVPVGAAVHLGRVRHVRVPGDRHSDPSMGCPGGLPQTRPDHRTAGLPRNGQGWLTGQSHGSPMECLGIVDS